MSTIKVDTLNTRTGSGNITFSRPITGLSGSGASLTALNATELTSGTLPMARLSGTLPALNGSALTTLNATELTSGTIPIARIADGAITSAKITDSTIVAGDIASDAITTAKIAANAVTTAKIAAGNVSTATVADLAINAAKLADNAVTTAKINADAVTGAKIADDAINSEHYAAASIDAEHLAVGKDGAHSLDATPNTDHTANGPQTSTHSAGYTTTIMDLVYLGSGNEWLEADADATGTSINLLGIALEVKNDGQPMNVALPGSFVRDDSWNWTGGVPLYISNTPGAITATKPTGSGDVVRTVGYAVASHSIYFNPSSDYVTLA